MSSPSRASCSAASSVGRLYAASVPTTSARLLPTRRTWNAVGGVGDFQCVSGRACAEGVDDIAYPVALGAAIAGHNLPLASSLETYGLAFASNLVSAALRLGAIGQTDGQRVLAALIPHIRECAHFAAQSTLDDLGGAALRSDIASMKHETQYSRLFRS